MWQLACRRTNRTSVLARPTGFEPTRTHSRKAIPIEGADDWEVATIYSA
jgi:hypothetical protein